MIRRRLLAGAATAVLLVLVPAMPAGAHTGVVEATDYEARIDDDAGLDVRLVEAGGRVELTNRTGDEIVVLGYNDEPYLRIGPGGVFENRRSPAVYINATRTGGEALPPEADEDAPPRWVRASDGRTARWHDHRLHWMQTDPPAVRDAPDERRRVAQWEIPVETAGGPVAIRGEIVYVPGPPTWPWIVAAAALAAAVVLAARRFGARRPLMVALIVLVAADVLRVVALSLVVAGDAGEQWRQAVDVGAASLVGWGLAVAAVVRLAGRHRDGVTAAGLAGVLLGVVGGVMEWGDLARSQLAVWGPAPLSRACVAAAVGLGAGIAVAVLAEVRRPTRAARRPAR